jgi:hypothetical protein
MKSKTENATKPIFVFGKPFEMLVWSTVDEVKSKLMAVDNTSHSFGSRFHTRIYVEDSENVFEICLTQGRGEAWYVGTIHDAPNGIVLKGQLGVGLYALLPIMIGIVLFVVFVAVFIKTQHIGSLVLAVGVVGLTTALTRYSIQWQKKQMKNALVKLLASNIQEISS